MTSINFYFATLTARHAWWLTRHGLGLLGGRQAVAETTWSDHVERAVGAWAGAPAFTFPSARCALMAALRAMGLGAGDEVLVTGFTCVAVPNAVLFAGARPTYVDIDPGTFNAGPREIEERIGPRTRAVVVQHTFGNPVDAGAIVAVARRHGLYVIEDCCLALGSRYDDRPVGSAGDAAIVSFELSKTLTAGWGGVVWVRDDAVAGRLRAMRARSRFVSRAEAARCSFQVAMSVGLYHPRVYGLGRYVAAGLYRTGLFRVSTGRDEARGRMPRGFEDRLSDAHWRVIADQWSRLDAVVERGRRTAAAYRRVLEEHEVPTFPAVSAAAAPAWSRFPFLVADRDGMRRYFGARGIELGQWFDSPIGGAATLAAVGYRDGDCPNAELVCRHVVNLPVHARLAEADVERIARHLAEYLRRHPENREFARAVRANAGPVLALP